MAIEHLAATDKPERIAEALARDGCCVVDQLVARERLDRLREELQPWLARTGTGRDDFSGRNTRRTGALIARSRTARELIEHPLVLATVKAVLHDATNFRLHLTQVIEIGPGAPAQDIHRDQWAFDFFPFPRGYEVQCNTLWAMTDFTATNGATRVVPGSNHYEDKLRLAERDSEPAEMRAGSALFYTGSVYHGGGANGSDQSRCGLNITYARAWLRQEENQYLSVPREIARELPESLQRLMGYSRGAYALGYVDDLRDPLDVLKPDLGSEGSSEGSSEGRETGFGDLPRTRRH